MAESSGSYGANGQWAFVPVCVGFGLGAAFVYGADVFMPYLVSLNAVSNVCAMSFYLGLVGRIPVFGVSDKVSFKPVSSATETS